MFICILIRIICYALGGVATIEQPNNKKSNWTELQTFVSCCSCIVGTQWMKIFSSCCQMIAFNVSKSVWRINLTAIVRQLHIYVYTYTHRYSLTATSCLYNSIRSLWLSWHVSCLAYVTLGVSVPVPVPVPASVSVLYNLINKFFLTSIPIYIYFFCGTDQLQWVLSVLWQAALAFVFAIVTSRIYYALCRILWATLMRLLASIVAAAAIKRLVESVLWGIVRI